MSDIVIKAENLGKKYTIGHQAENGRYLALRDVLVHNARNLWHKTRDLARGKAIIQGDTLEEVWALRDVSFEIQRGDVVGIIGRNGAGKSTLLKILSRITEPSAGRVTIKGRVASLLEVGTGFHPELTGRENIYLNSAILGMTRQEIKRKFDEIVDFAEVEKFLDTPVKRYSSGMYVRLAFAVAAHMEPEILVVDEVLAVGDAAFQKKCLGKMGDVAKEGRTVLFVSHNMAAIRLLCRKGLLLNEGRLVANDTAERCMEIYTNEFTERRGTLLDHLAPHDLTVQVTHLQVNGSPFDTIQIGFMNTVLQVDCVFVARVSCRVSIHAFLKDSYGHTLAIFSPGHMNGSVFRVLPGQHNLLSRIELPRLTQGRYFLDIGVADPSVRAYVDFPFGLELLVEGVPTETGYVFEQGGVNGFLVLNGSVTSAPVFADEGNNTTSSSSERGSV